jgi:hypothetical protein
MKVLAEELSPHSLKLELEAEAGTVAVLKLRRNAPHLNVRAEGASIVSMENQPGPASLDWLTVKFPTGRGYQQQMVIVRW